MPWVLTQEAKAVTDTMDAKSRPAPRWADAWQLPTLLLGVAMFAVGWFMAAQPEDRTAHWGRALDGVHDLIVAGRHAAAIDELEGYAAAIESQDDALRSRYHMLLGDALSLGQRTRTWDRPPDHARVVESYVLSQRYGPDLDAPRVRRLAEARAAMGETEAALDLLRGLGEAGGAARQQMLRRAIESAMEDRDRDDAAVERLIDELLHEPRIMPANEVWAAARRAELALDRGETRQAVDMLLRWVVRLGDAGDAPLGEIKLQLGRAYLADGDPKRAEQWLIRADQSLAGDDERRGQVLLGLGRVRFGEDNIIEALEHYSAVVEHFAHTPAFPEGLLGKAESEARRGALDAALADYTRAVRLAMDRPDVWADARPRLLDRLAALHEARFARGDYDTALRLLGLEGRLFAERPPADLVRRRAVTHERLARSLLGLGEGQQVDRASWADLGGDVRREAAEHFAAAADAFRDHALATVYDDAEASSRSLWRAGELYETAGLHREAVAVYHEFVEHHAEDERGLAARRRLAQAHQDAGEFEQAIELYRVLTEDHPTSPEAYASLVPLAQCYLALGPDHTDRAEAVLRSVVTDHPALRPESREYRAALIELGRLYYQRGGEGDYERAIRRLDEAVKRYEDDPQRAELLFQLGDAYRQSVRRIEAELAGSLPPSRRAELQAERARRLERAGESFEAVIEAYAGIEGDGGEADELLRHSYFYRAECAFDLGRYDGSDGAIELYEQARAMYDRDPAVLAVLVQIVNSYAELGRWEEARRANERAKVYLRRIPDGAFDDPHLPMRREHWEAWLDRTSDLALGDTEP